MNSVSWFAATPWRTALLLRAAEQLLSTPLGALAITMLVPVVLVVLA